MLLIENSGGNGGFAVKKDPKHPLQTPPCVAYRSDHMSLSSRQLFNTGKFLSLLFTLVLSYIFICLLVFFLHSKVFGVLFLCTLFLKILLTSCKNYWPTNSVGDYRWKVTFTTLCALECNISHIHMFCDKVLTMVLLLLQAWLLGWQNKTWHVALILKKRMVFNQANFH